MLRSMRPSHDRPKPASMAGFLALIWILWTGLGAWQVLLAQRYLEFGYAHLAMLTLRSSALQMLPHLILGVPVSIVLLRLLRLRRTIAAVLGGVLMIVLCTIFFSELPHALRAHFGGGWLRRLALYGLLALIVSGGSGFGYIMGRRRLISRLSARAAEGLDAMCVNLRARRAARICGHRGILAVAALGLGVCLALPLLSRPATVHGPSVVLILIDTLRADHLGCYGYSRDTSPNIDRWASDAMVFEQALAQASWTKPSVASLFTSLYLSVHRTGSGLHVRRRAQMGEVALIPASPDAPQTTAHLPTGAVTVAEVFRAAGYRTAGFTANRLVSKEFNYDQGFETHAFGGDRRVTSGAINWLDRHGEEPFFLYLHYMAPHAPYKPPEAFNRFTTRRKMFNIYSAATKDSINYAGTLQPTFQDVTDLIDQYDGEILYSDDQAARVLTHLGRLGLKDHTIVILTSDHGEEFLDHGMVWHASVHLYNELVRVPLVIDLPGIDGSGERVSAPIMQIDLGPTLFELTELDVPPEMQGRSFAALLRGEALTSREAYTETIDWGWKQAIRSGERKLILDRDTGEMELFDLTRDPGERDPALDLPGPEIKALHDSLEAQYGRNLLRLDPKAVGIKMGITAEELERLRSLGYIQ